MESHDEKKENKPDHMDHEGDQALFKLMSMQRACNDDGFSSSEDGQLSTLASSARLESFIAATDKTVPDVDPAEEVLGRPRTVKFGVTTVHRYEDLSSEHSIELAEASEVEESLEDEGEEGEEDEEDVDFLAPATEWLDHRDTVAEEWGQLADFQNQMEMRPKTMGIQRKEGNSAAAMKFRESIEYFRREVAEHHLQVEAAAIVNNVERGFLGTVLNCLCGPPAFQADLRENRDLLFTIAKVKLDDQCIQHLRILNTVYMKLTGNHIECPRYGSHWEIVGFQGSDPSTDLRGAGMLGLVQIIYFIQNHKIEAMDVFRLSRHPQQHFPFVLVGFEMTALTIVCLRNNALAREANARKDVIEAAMEFYCASFYMMYTIWKRQQKTIEDFGFVLLTVKEYAKEQPRQIIQDMYDDIARRTRVAVEGDKFDLVPQG